MLSEVGWRWLVSFRDDRLFVAPNKAGFPHTDIGIVCDLLTLAGVHWSISDVFTNYIIIHEPLNP